MAGRDPLDLEFVIERRSHLLHLLCRRYDQMKAASDSVKLRVDRGGVLKYFLDARMRASHHDGEPLRCLDRQRHLVHIACARLFGDSGQYEKAWKNFRRLPYDLEIRLRPWRTRAKGVRLRAPIVAHVGRQTGSALKKCDWRGRIEVRAFHRSVDLHGWINLLKVVQTRRMVAVAMRDHHCVELGQINVELIDVVLEDLGVVSGVEQNAATVVLNKCGESPIHFQG